MYLCLKNHVYKSFCGTAWLCTGLIFIWLIAILNPITAKAALTIEITKGQGSGTPIAIVPFVWKGSSSPPENLHSIVISDLNRTSRFDLLPSENFLRQPGDARDVKFKNWRLIKAEALVLGRITEISSDKYEIVVQVLDVYRERVKVELRYTVTGAQFRQVAHQISDRIYLEITGVPGAFDSRIAFVTVQRAGRDKIYRLMVADSDGQNEQEILKTTNLPVISPAWRPNGRELAYVSYSDSKSGANVWLQDLTTGERKPFLEGSNANASAPSWSPDGNWLALTMSSDGNTDIYVIKVGSGKIKRLTRSPAIDTEPSWSPDGRHIVFTSDRSGRPQIYRIKRTGGDLTRVTNSGKENAKASYDPSGKRLVMVTNMGRGAGDQIGVFYPSRGSTVLLTDGSYDESPTFSPNGEMVLYAAKMGKTGVLAVVSSDGRSRHVLKMYKGDVREPAWSNGR